MASQTLVEAAKLINNEIVRGVAEDIIDLNPWFAMLPFDGYDGQSVTINREDDTAFDGVGFVNTRAVGDTTPSDAMKFKNFSYSATKIIGDAQVDDLVQAQSLSAGVDQVAVEIASKTKAVGRRFQIGMAEDEASGADMNSLHYLAKAAGFGAAGRYNACATGGNIAFIDIDTCFENVKAKQGIVDWGLANAYQVRAVKALMRAAGGTTADWIMNIPFVDGRNRSVIAYEGTPIFRNDHLLATETADGVLLTTGALTSLWAGCWDDGTRRVGVAGIYPSSVPAGIVVESVGARETLDERIWRIKWYANFAVYNFQGLARLTDLDATP